MRSQNPCRDVALQRLYICIQDVAAFIITVATQDLCLIRISHVNLSGAIAKFLQQFIDSANISKYLR
ncbi:MAG: hypothetical protein RMX96_29780 [Nostoc sp. ChiSLP02]|nr:hypothetical protein [Nostoc sp. DedSLP05]MDZ8100641.1 hypothetical protein [Nostoc sp. DedSLP01]MDZ8189022.1 hypothetical protein [Nostoc sp. ChiSLP02]